MMPTASTKLPASLGWKYPSQSPFLGRIMAPPEEGSNKPLAPRADTRDIRVKRPRHLAWLDGGEERVGYSILGRRIPPQCEARRSPRVK